MSNLGHLSFLLTYFLLCIIDLLSFQISRIEFLKTDNVAVEERRSEAIWWWAGGGVTTAGVAAGIVIWLQHKHEHKERIPLCL
jgi:hypothetical protein